MADFTGYYIDGLTAGSSGTSGFSGYSGAVGTSGFSGYSGTLGTSGFSGYSGSSGAVGTSGFSGYSGIHGCAETYTFVVDGFEWATAPFTLPRYLSGWHLTDGGIQATLSRSGSNWQLYIYDIANEWYATYSTTALNGCPSTNISDWSLLGENGTSTTFISVTSSNEGISGFSGYSGSSGAVGTSGFSGYSGTSGAVGTSGFSGYSGGSILGSNNTFTGTNFFNNVVKLKASVWHTDTNDSERMYWQSSGPIYLKGMGTGAALQVRNASNADIYQVNHDGSMIVYNSTVSGASSRLYVKASAGQTTDLFQIQNNSNTVLGGFNSIGQLFIVTGTPASASAAGVTGTVIWDANYIYICTATNTWKRVSISTW